MKEREYSSLDELVWGEGGEDIYDILSGPEDDDAEYVLSWNEDGSIHCEWK